MEPFCSEPVGQWRGLDEMLLRYTEMLQIGGDCRPKQRNRMSIELPKEARDEAIASIMRYFKENMDDPIGNIAASGLLGYFLEEIGPLVYKLALDKIYLCTHCFFIFI